VATGVFYAVTFVVNIIMMSRNFASVTFYVYTLSKILVIVTLILTYILTQKSNKNSKKQENNQNENN